jgi:hypothetical protein
VASVGYVVGALPLVAAALLVLNNVTVRVPLSCRLLVTGLVTIGLGTLVPLLGSAGDTMPHPARFAGDVLVLLSLCCFVLMLAQMMDAARSIRPVVLRFGFLFAAVVLVMTAGLALGTLVYRLAFGAGMAILSVTVAVMSARYVIRAQTAELARAGVALVLGSGGCFLLAAAWYLARAAVPETLIRSAVVLLVIGMTLPSWGTYLLVRLRRWRAGRLVRAVTPLWRALADAVPEVRLPDPPSDVEVLLYRRVIESWDAELVLSSYLPADFEEFAAARLPGMAAAERPVVGQAAGLTVAMAAYRAGEPARENPADWLRSQRAETDALQGARVLVTLARAMRDPAVERISREYLARRDAPAG